MVRRDVLTIHLVCDRIVQTEIVIVECPIADRAKTERERTATLSPNVIAEVSRRTSPRFQKIFAGEDLELDRAGVSNSEIKRINFINDLLRIRPNLKHK